MRDLLLKAAMTVTLVLLSYGVSAQLPFDYRVTDQKPQARENFVQGMQIVGQHLYISTGGYGESKLLRYNFSSGELEQSVRLSPRHFGEGVTVFDNQIYQLTWRARMLLVYHRDTMQPSHWFKIPGEGWGITHNNEHLIYSDGSDKLYFINPTTGEITHSISVTEDSKPVRRLNELEFIKGQIWANVWQSNRLVIIDSASGVVNATVDLQGLLPPQERRSGTDVLNGIALDPTDQSIWVTGKRWPWQYQIELLPLKAE